MNAFHRHIRRMISLLAGVSALSLLSSSAFADPVIRHHTRLEAQRETSAGAGSVVKKATDPVMNTQNSVTTQDKAALPELPDIAVETPVLPGEIRTIVIDPGHGGTNAGAIGVARIHEKYLTLQVALIVADRLRAKMPDVNIVLTRQRDEALSLTERIQMANQIQADLFVSLHFNSSTNPEAIGYESFWAGDFWAADMEKNGETIDDQTRETRTKTAKLGERMAKCFNHAMHRRFDVLDRGVKPGDYTVLTRAAVPSVVLELAFLSHAQEGIGVVSQSVRSKLADAVVDAIVKYGNVDYIP